jgi:hypothetical protein
MRTLAIRFLQVAAAVVLLPLLIAARWLGWRPEDRPPPPAIRRERVDPLVAGTGWLRAWLMEPQPHTTEAELDRLARRAVSLSVAELLGHGLEEVLVALDPDGPGGRARVRFVGLLCLAVGRVRGAGPAAAAATTRGQTLLGLALGGVSEPPIGAASPPVAPPPIAE